jgi:hypothetical protein
MHSIYITAAGAFVPVAFFCTVKNGLFLVWLIKKVL